MLQKCYVPIYEYVIYEKNMSQKMHTNTDTDTDTDVQDATT